MRRAARIDNNQTELVDLFRAAGMSVAVTSSSHDGFPDLVLGYGGVTVLVEVKDGAKPPSGRQLTEQQKDFHAAFKGAITIVEDAEQALCLVKAIRQAAVTLAGTNWNMGAVANVSR